MHKSPIMVCLVYLLTACSSTYQAKDIPSDEAITTQEGALKKIFKGQPKNDVLKLMSYSISHSFDVIEGEDSYSYKELQNFDTNVAFGLYFENEELEAVILDDDVNDLFSCRTLFKTNRKHWLSHGIEPYQNWIRSKDHLTRGLDYRINHPQIVTKQKVSDKIIENTLSAIVYAPFLVAAAPFVIHDEITGQTDKKRTLFSERLDLAKAVAIRTTEEDILAKLGQPDQIDYVAKTKVLTYYGPSYSYGIENGVVLWKEQFSMFELYNRQFDYGSTFYGKTDCGSLDTYWEANK